jgi:hypothetical protein
MVTYYIESPNGKYLSEDGKRKFDRYTGTSAYEYLNSEEAEGKRFFKFYPDDNPDNEINIEVPMNLIKKHRQEERRRQYKNDIMEESEFVVISLFAMDSSSTTDDAISGEELIAEETSDIVEDIFRKFELERLRRALAQLSDDEYQLIYDLFLQENPPSERFYSRAKGIPQKTVNCRKLAIFKKIKNILQFSSLK